MKRTTAAAPLLAAAIWAGCGGGASSTTSHAPPPAPLPRHAADHRVAVHYAGRLPAPVQLPAVTATGDGGVDVIGGLNSADASVDSVLVVDHRHARPMGHLPTALHDGAAATLGRRAYFFGGGSAAGTSADIVELGRGKAHTAGRLPRAASDVQAAVVGSTAYVVGGYDGSAPLDSIVAFAPGRPAHVVAHLPLPLRYAAVTSAGGAVIVAGGTSGATATRGVLRFDPTSGRVRRIGSLPHPVTHAAAVPLGGRVYVIGGRGDNLSSQRSTILSVDPRTGRVAHAGRLPIALSDVGATAVPGAALVVGGRDSQGRVHAGIWRLTQTAARRPSGRDPASRAASPAASSSNVYAAAGPNDLIPAVRNDPARVYVPNSQSNTVDVISQGSFRVIDHFAVGALPQHVTPAWDMRRLWVTNDQSNSLTPIDPRTGHHGKPVPVTDPYNLYFTVDGRYAIVVAEAHARLDFRFAHSMRLHRQLHVPQCAGVDHMDFTADGRYALASCEFSGRMIVVDLARERVRKTLSLPGMAKPQDVKLSPDGRTFYVADMMANGVWTFDAHRMRRTGFIRTGRGAHGLYPSRDARYLYVSNRDGGSISVISFRRKRVVDTWHLPGGGSPDMGGVSADGRILWLTGRYNGELYAISTRSGRLLHRIEVGSGPHGAAVWPQPGRYSIGHTGITR
ncbi:MAG: beta-propeller fold lactonase family protein [Solirubrobacteraceae bacterium]